MRKHFFIIILIIISNFACGMGLKPATLIENTLESMSRSQYHALLTIVTTTDSKEANRELQANGKHAELPINLVIATIPTTNLTSYSKTLHNGKIELWYLVTQSAELVPIVETLISTNSDIDGLMLMTADSLGNTIKALENAKITIAQHKSELQLGCRIPTESGEETTAQLFNTINLAIVPATTDDPLLIARDIGPTLTYAQEIKTPVYIELKNTAQLAQATPQQLSKYIALLNSGLENKKYRGFLLRDADIDSIWQTKTSKKR